MKPDIHPNYQECDVKCLGCGNTFKTRSTKDSISVEVCANCHGFYTGKQKLIDTAGRVERFEKRYGRRKKSAATSSDAGTGGASDSESE